MQNHSYRAEIIELKNLGAKDVVDEILSTKSPTVVNRLENTIKEWCKISNPAGPHTPEVLQQQADEFFKTREKDTFGGWAYYPWLNTLVRIPEREMYIALRTSRNQYKITPEEQQKLAKKTIGVVGLSVGQSVAVTMAMERIFGKIKLADFDTLDLSNLNRLRAGVHQLGLPKTVIAAREIAQIDPYLEVELYNDGITDENLDNFLHGGGTLDLLCEECDSLDVKIKLREACKRAKIPVIMDTSDRGMLDIERFDLEPGRPMFHGRAGELTSEILATMNPQEKMGIMMQIVDVEKISNRMKLSLTEIGKTITTWPQLASSITIGGGVSAEVARKILLGESVPSGRFYIDLDLLVR